MRKASAASLERLFALIVTVGIPAGGAGAMVACGGETQGTGSKGTEDGGASSSGSSSGTGSSGSSSGTSSNGTSSGVNFGGSSGSGSSSGTSSGGSGSGSSCGGCGVICGENLTLDGGLPDASAFDASDPGGFDVEGGLPSSECQELCGFSALDCTVTSEGPPAVVFCRTACVGGRRPASLQCGAAAGETSPGHYFASLAQLEAGSVPAFRRMARELSRFGAPRRLVKAAERAAREEVRHARGAAALAKRYGAKRAAFTADVRGERSLEAFATENAVEGCVRETYGALVATWQAREAGDPLVRAHMARIAKEETRHAALAWRADAWARGKLAKDARARVEAARRNAARALIDEVTTATGVPTALVARRLASDLVATLA